MRQPPISPGANAPERVGKLVSLNVGMPREVSWQGRTVFTGIWKEPVDGSRRVRRLNVDGDGQGDLAGHGGEQRSVYVYQLGSYRYWRKQLDRDDFGFGQFGENFTVEGLGDHEVCIGDRYGIGSAVFEVTQPRVTCYRLGIRMDEPRMPAMLTGSGRPGFYFRVIEEGAVQAGDDIVKLATGPEQMTVEAVNALLYVERRPDRVLLQRALRIPALSPGWQRSFRALLDQHDSGAPQSGNAGLAVIAPPPAWQGFRPLQVVAKRFEGASAVSLELATDDGSVLAPRQPGQFVTLKLRSRDAEPPLVRSYSLSGSPGDATYRITVKIDPHGAASSYVRTTVQVGDRLQVAAPRGQFTLDETARPVVLVSAGVGVTPVLAMLHALHDIGSTRAVWWCHGARNGAQHLFAEEARSLLAALPAAHQRVWYSQPEPDDRMKTDYDEVGHVTAEGIVAAGAPTDAEVYLCGPTEFMDGIRTGLAAVGVAPLRVHTEAFGAEAPINPGIVASVAQQPHAPVGLAGKGPLLSFVRTGLSVNWDDSYASILELAEACDAPVRWSCRAGVCHTCETQLLDGTITYDPEPLELPDTGKVLVCCARPDTDLMLDL